MISFSVLAEDLSASWLSAIREYRVSSEAMNYSEI
jgi:hypothetical protein